MVEGDAQVPDATVPAPRIRLVAFERIRDVPPGKSVEVKLTVTPASHAVVLDNGHSVYDAHTVVQAGRLQLFVGGAQPGLGRGCLNATVAVKNSEIVKKCSKP
jgi:beta-glucosidase